MKFGKECPMLCEKNEDTIAHWMLTVYKMLPEIWTKTDVPADA